MSSRDIVFAAGGGSSTGGGPLGDGENWTYRTGIAEQIGRWQGEVIAWNGSVFCVFGYNGKNPSQWWVLTSPDGITWTHRPQFTQLNPSQVINAVTSNGSKFVAVCDNGVVFTSIDNGVTWQTQSGLSSTSWGTNDVNDIAWSPTLNLFCAVGQYGGIAISSDGVAWQNIGVPPGWPSPIYDAVGITWGGNKFCLIGINGEVAVSTNGTAWTYTSNLLAGWSKSDSYIPSIAWNGTIFCATSGSHANSKTARSTDGLTWQISSVYSASMTKSLSSNGSIFVAVSNGTLSGGGRIYTSTDGLIWTAENTPYNFEVYAIAWNGSVFCTVGVVSGVNKGGAATSTNGYQTWISRQDFATTAIPLMGGATNAIAWNGSVFCAVGDDGDVVTSFDGATWTDQPQLRTSSGWGNASSVNAIAWNPNTSTLCIGGHGGKIATSTDNGVTWIIRTLPTEWGTTVVRTIIWNGSVFCAAGDAGKVAVSGGSGDSWQYRPYLSLTSGWGAFAVNAIAYNPNTSTLCIVGSSGRVATSTDNGVTWTDQPQLRTSSGWGNDSVNAIAWNPNTSTLCIGGLSGKIATSTDNGVTWTYTSNLRNSSWGDGGSTTVRSIAWNGSVFCAVGDGGRVATSPTGAVWTNRVLPPLVSKSNSYIWTSKSNDIVWNGYKFVVVGESCKAATSP